MKSARKMSASDSERREEEVPALRTSRIWRHTRSSWQAMSTAGSALRREERRKKARMTVEAISSLTLPPYMLSVRQPGTATRTRQHDRCGEGGCEESFCARPLSEGLVDDSDHACPLGVGLGRSVQRRPATVDMGPMHGAVRVQRGGHIVGAAVDGRRGGATYGRAGADSDRQSRRSW